MNQYRIYGGHGWTRTLWCYAKEAVELWKKAGKGARLYIVRDGDEVLIRGGDEGSIAQPQQTTTLPLPRTFKAEEPTPQPEIPDPTVTETEERESYNHPVRSWFATPSW